MKNVYTSVEPFYVVSKFLGMFPMSFDGSLRKGKLKVTCVDVLTTIIAAIVPFTLVLLNLFYKSIPDDSRTFLSELWIAENNFGVFLTLVRLPYQLYKFKSIERFLKKVHQFDEKVVKKGSSFKLVIFYQKIPGEAVASSC